MLLLSFSHVLLLTFSCSLLALTNVNWLLYYLATDMGLFVNLSGAVRFFTALLMRFAVKMIVNFTLLIQLRNPCEVGGAMYLVFGSIVSSCGLRVSLYVHIPL